MRILAIETSCDETAIAILEIKGSKESAIVSIWGNALHSQVKLHQKYGGVFPMMAKREHAKTLTPLLLEVLKEAKMLRYQQLTTYNLQKKKVEKILEREGELAKELIELLEKIEKPKIDCLAVANGPGLEPALWVGINFAKALSLAWDIPVIPINHMEGHIFASLMQSADKRRKDADGRRKNSPLSATYTITLPPFPLLALLISGGHTELVLSRKVGSYKVIGETKDDAVGEAFDKVARMLGLKYPGGPQISRLAEEARQLGHRMSKLASKRPFPLPRPMLHSKNLDFSFSGLKTAVLYTLKKMENKNPDDISDEIKCALAKEFEDAVTEVLLAKTKEALAKTKAKTLIIGGGVSANKNIRNSFTELIKKEFPKVKFLIPEQSLTTDNAIMIGLVAYYKFNAVKKYSKNFIAKGSLSL